jgi:hypothetical protein
MKISSLTKQQVYNHPVSRVPYLFQRTEWEIVIKKPIGFLIQEFGKKRQTPSGVGDQINQNRSF